MLAVGERWWRCCFIYPLGHQMPTPFLPLKNAGLLSFSADGCASTVQPVGNLITNGAGIKRTTVETNRWIGGELLLIKDNRRTRDVCYYCHHLSPLKSRNKAKAIEGRKSRCCSPVHTISFAHWYFWILVSR